jgi:hypothetical protein
VAGTEAVHSDDPMTPEAAQEMSQQILGDLGIATDQVDGADHTGENLAPTNPPAGTEPGAEASATPTMGQEVGVKDEGVTPAPEQNAAWVATLPEEVQANLSQMHPQTITRLREIAEGGLRLDDYTRKTQKVSQDSARLTELEQKAQFADLISQNRQAMAAFYAEDPQAAAAQEEAVPSIADLMKTNDPDAFAQGLDAIIEQRIGAKTEQVRQNDPNQKAATVNAAADQIHKAIQDRLPEGAWDRACGLYVEHCETKGVAWYDTPIDQLAMEMRPHLRFALAEHAARGAAPQVKSGESAGMSTPEQRPDARAAAIPSSGANVATSRTPPHVREGREISEDEAYQKTMTKFGIANEDELARLRRLD